jgi:hypothetical protein
MVWGGLAIGAVVGGKDAAADSSTNNIGGAVSGDKENKGAQGLFSAFGHQVWLYVGGIVGFGEKAGVYVTTGPMFGHDFDWAIGGGVHLGKVVGLGVVVPIRQALMAASAHSEKISYLMDRTQDLVAQGTHYISTMGGGLAERVSTDPMYALASVACLGMCVAAGTQQTNDLEGITQNETIVEKTKGLYNKTKTAIQKRMYML